MAWYSWLVGTPKIAEKITDTAANAINTGVKMIDEAFYTDQEKAAEKVKYTQLFLDLQKLLVNDSGVSSIARRAVATVIMITFCFLVIMAAGVFAIPTIGEKWAGHILNVIDVSNLGYLAMLVGGFFFGFYAFGKYTKWGTTNVMNGENNDKPAN
jgi:hypothetical protein